MSGRSTASRAAAAARVRSEPTLAILLVAAVVLRVLLVRDSPTPFGYVWDFYYEGVRLLYERRRLPVAANCWQCYHPPLFYLLGWPFYAFGRWIDAGPGDATALRWLGALPMACGECTIFYGYRLLRLFRCHGALLVLGVALLLTFPCLFISSYGAEADIVVTALISALAFYMTRDLAIAPPRRRAAVVRLGVLCGLAAATKYSGLVGILAVLAVLALHAIAGRRRGAALQAATIISLVCALVGGWKYLDNLKWYGTPFQANGSAANSFSLRSQWPAAAYEFSTIRMGELLDLFGPNPPRGQLTNLPVYRSVPTTLHALAWTDMTFFSQPDRHGDASHPYPQKRETPMTATLVLVLAFVPDALAVLGFVLAFRRRTLRPLVVLTIVGLATYTWWFLGQAQWGLKTKYILFLLPAFVTYVVVGTAWIHRRAPAVVNIAISAALATLILALHVYLLAFSIG